MAFLTSFGEKHEILHFSQQGFTPQRNTTRQIQRIIATLEDAKLTNNDIYLAYIDFENTFGSMDHARLLAQMEDLGYPKDAIELISNIYTNSTTSHDNHFSATSLNHINIGTIQDYTVNMYLFIIFLDPFLRWLEKTNIGYHFNTSTTTCYTNALAIVTNNLASIQSQINKLQKFFDWAHLDLDLTICAITGRNPQPPNMPKQIPP